MQCQTWRDDFFEPRSWLSICQLSAAARVGANLANKVQHMEGVALLSLSHTDVGISTLLCRSSQKPLINHEEKVILLGTFSLLFKVDQ